MNILLVAACLPSVVLLVFIYKKDKTEKEPFGLLALLFILGALSCFPIAGIENMLSAICPFAEGGLLYNIYENFLVAGMCEEVGKFLILFVVTHKNKSFNCLFDGVIYAVVVSLGFATLENILYVSSYGFATAVVRAVTSVPGHMFFGVLMGTFYTMWHLGKNLSLVEQEYHRLGYIDRIVTDKYQLPYLNQLVMALLVPIAVHGMYDFLLSFSSWLATIVFVAFLVLLYVYCFSKINKLSKEDQHEVNLIAGVLNRRYPYLYPRIRQAMARQQMQYNPFTQRSYNPYSAPTQNTPYQPGSNNQYTHF